jgi:hypothetical protein
MTPSRSVCGASAVAALVLLLGSCAIAGVDTHDRISAFVSTLNSSDRSTINANFDQSLTANLPTMDAAWWSANFPLPPDSDHNYGITLLDYSNPADVVATLMGPPAFNSNTGTPRNAVLVMSKAGVDWFIERLYLDGSATALIK